MLKNIPYIIFDAEPFCFGPISTTLNVVEKLKRRNKLTPDTKFILLGTLTSSQLGQKSGLFDEIYECDTTSATELSRYSELISGASLYIINTNINSIDFVSTFNTPIIYIDTLFWMWNNLHVDLHKTEKTFIQDFHGIERNIERFHDKLGNYQVIPPILHNSLQRCMMDDHPPEGILITLGGIDTVYADTTDFYYHFLNELLSIPQLQNENNITIAGGGKTIVNLAEIFSKTHPHIHIGCFSRHDFLQKLHRARKVLANPGLTTFYECVTLHKDVFFLPPQNYSQQLQLDVYLQNYYSHEYGFLWQPEYGYPDIPPYLPEKEGLALIKKCNDLFINNPIERKRAINKISQFLAKEENNTISCHTISPNNSDDIIADYIENRMSNQKL
ncbi:hypothetical protein [Xenorhabdus griffiniae]|uniref:Glycosyltransferase n=1 Tax=Xenorhabdus griffiniae TaxID=351672 RepID=A0ABY9XDL4_9GAMM|nr:hypothetical protein [Xenorhabdus griffiniae]MBD1227349.1 hypothetical protein [Xenorhabdus griffiniae]MBE8588868.1 hypothetical protein [Xenorhabdus griffiniae]WMV71009.1 hypothetical protein QL128_12450 [Xenorhabdus griffiniae]WNH00685.1 hypothetical protein QL112_012455 [Xenorhabdus griffiniae]